MVKTNLIKNAGLFLVSLIFLVLISSLVLAGDGRTNCVTTQPIIKWEINYVPSLESFILSYHTIYCGIGNKSILPGSYGDFPIQETVYAGTMPWTYYFIGDLAEGCGGATTIEECEDKIDNTRTGRFYETKKCYRTGTGTGTDIGFDQYGYDVKSHYAQILNNEARVEGEGYSTQIGTQEVQECQGNDGYRIPAEGERTEIIPKDEMVNKIIRTHALIHLVKSNCYDYRCRNTRLGISKLPDCYYDSATDSFSGECCDDESIQSIECTKQCYLDKDNDKYTPGGNITAKTCPVDYYTQEHFIDLSLIDCDDNNALIYPGATEICDNGLDDDCNGLTDCADSDCASKPVCEIACNDNSDCGIGVCWETDNYCSGNTLYNNHTNFICNNPGTTESYCSQEHFSYIIAYCTYNCENAMCVI